MEDENKSWGKYGELVFRELERLNDNYESLRKDFDSKLTSINKSLSDAQAVEKTVNEQKIWIEKVTEVWSATQMKEAKDEIYKQKSRWTATIAVLVFVEILVGIALTLIQKL